RAAQAAAERARPPVRAASTFQQTP
ncbi:hypothetical protein BMAFMH_E0658, partial [Burkholderia mallei FMH]